MLSDRENPQNRLVHRRIREVGLARAKTQPGHCLRQQAEREAKAIEKLAQRGLVLADWSGPHK